MSTTVSHRIMLFNEAGYNIGSISPLTLAALQESGLLAGETPSQEISTPLQHTCIHCGDPATKAVPFCPDCVCVILDDGEGDWLAAWLDDVEVRS